MPESNQFLVDSDAVQLLWQRFRAKIDPSNYPQDPIEPTGQLQQPGCFLPGLARLDSDGARDLMAFQNGS
jgi:hypothetical protein